MWVWWCFFPGVYFLWLLWTRYRWARLSSPPIPTRTELPSVSVLIPARNEAGGIAYLLKDLLEQDYPKDLLEILVIDDHSEDDTLMVAQALQGQGISCHSLGARSGKKAALALGLELARGQWVVTVDADVRMGRQWLRQLLSMAPEEGVHALAGPVAYGLPEAPDTLEQLVALDNAGMQGLTAVGMDSGLWILGNGANLAYRKDTVTLLGGYSGNLEVSSGDDVLLLQTLHQRKPGSVRYVLASGALVWTDAPADWKSFWQQRLRWAGKSNAYTHRGIYYVQALAWLTSAQAMIALLVVPWMGPAPMVMTWMWKGVADYLWLRATAPWYGAAPALRNFMWIAPLQWAYVFLIGTAALLKVPVQWKGRPVQHGVI